MTPSGIEPATFRFVAQHLNHCATAVPSMDWVRTLCEQKAVVSVIAVGTFGNHMVLKLSARHSVLSNDQTPQSVLRWNYGIWWSRVLVEKIRRLLWDPNIHRHVHKSPPLDPVLSPIHPVCVLTPYYLKIQFSSPPFSSSCAGTPALLLWVYPTTILYRIESYEGLHYTVLFSFC